MSAKIYPDLQKICRLCLKENEGTICIFPKEKSSDKYSALSIPMLIMTCTSLNVQDSDDFPQKICTDCRLQLEKSYYFRKKSQASDAKLKKHLRLVSMGKISKVFDEKLDDDDEDELDFKDSIEFIRKQDGKKKQEENREVEEKVTDIKLQHERKLEPTKETVRTKYQEELVPLIKEEIKTDLKAEVQNEMEENLRQAIMDKCQLKAKELVRSEVREQCRQSEVKSLQTYLTNKKQTLEESPGKISKLKLIKSSKKQPQVIGIASKLEYVEIELQSQREHGANISNQIVTKEEINISDEECDSDGNFLTYNIDEGFEVQKKMSDSIEGHHADNDANYMDYEDEQMENKTFFTKLNASDMDNNGESQEATSYKIDNKNGEIQFLKNIKDFNDSGEDNLDQSSYENKLTIKLSNNMNGDFVKEFEEAKCTKPLEKYTKSIVSSSVARKKTRVRAKVVTKTYVNPMQRSTDTPKIFRCNDCPIVFSTKHSFERHLRTHEKVEKLGVTFQCPECRIVVSCSSALRRHMYTHYEKKPFSCNLCDKSFVQKEILKRHMRSHTGVKPHQCPHCGRDFAQRINLTQHINRHHLQEPRIQQHSCHLCPKRFNHASGLSRHLATHSGAVFQCSECDRTFGNRASIKRHIANMHINANIVSTPAINSDIICKKTPT